MLRTKNVICTNLEHLGTIQEVPVRAADVTRRYLLNLLETGRFNKKELALAMDTSRSQLDNLLKKSGAPNLMSKHIDGISAHLHSSPAAVWKELHGLAVQMEKSPDAELELDHELPGRADRRKVSADRSEVPVDEADVEQREPSLPSPRPRRPAGQSPRRTR